MCLNYACIIFILFFNLRLHVFHVQFCCFLIGRSNKRNYIAFEKKNDILFEPRREKTVFCTCENKGADQLRGIFFISYSFLKDLNFLFLFPIQTYKRPNLTLP